jgi:hypothetical protein
MGDRKSLAVGLAGLVLFGFGLTVIPMPLLFLPRVDGSLISGLLGEDFAIPHLVALAVWPLGPLSFVGGYMVMTGRSRNLGLMCTAAWAALGLLATLAGAAPGLFLIFLVVGVILWRTPVMRLEPRP